MRNLFLTSTAALVLLLSGCSQKTPEIDASQENSSVEITDGTGTSKNVSGVDASLTGSKLISKLEGELKSIYFNYDQFGLKADMRDDVVNNANLLKNGNAANLNIKLEGNCDEWGTDEYNMALGLKRAKSVKESLISKGIDSSRITVVTYGENNPACSEKTKSCWSQNRRVDFKLFQ